MAKKTLKATRYDEIAGKVVAGCGISGGEDRILVSFTDGTCLALTASGSYEGPVIDFEQGRDIDLLGHRWVSAAEDGGMITSEEYHAVQKEIRAAELKQLRERLASMERHVI